MSDGDRGEIEVLAVRVGATTWRIRTSGAVDAPQLLLLGHVPDVSWSLDELHRLLSLRFRVLQPERLDAAESSGAFPEIAGSLAALLETTTTSRTLVVGSGFGGTVAAHLGSMRPDLVRAVLMVNAEYPDVHRVDGELAGAMADAYAYVADFLDPAFEQSAAAGDVGLLTQFWQSDPWWPEHEARYRDEVADPEFLARVARAYRANYRLLDVGGTFSQEDADRRSAFGRHCAAVRAGEPRRVVAPAADDAPVLLEVPTLLLFSGDRGPARAHGYEALSRFVERPVIVNWPDRCYGVHHGHPEQLAELVREFDEEVAARLGLAVEAPLDPSRERRDSEHIVARYDVKIRDFRSPVNGSADHALRGSHPKTHGVVRSTFVVEPDLPPDLRLGLFAEPRAAYECVMRFSSLGNPELGVFHDAERDVRGVGIKLLEPGTSNTLNDFLLNTVPILSTKNGRDVVPQNLDFMDLEHLLDYSDELVVPHVLEVSYYSQTPYRYGARRAVKYRLRPQPLPADLTDDGVDHGDPAFLRRRLEHVLSHADGDVVLDFMVQFQTDPVLDPIEDPRVEWRGEYVKVAEIRIPPQQLAAASDEHDEGLSFHLYHCRPEHAPMGAVNRSRRAVYSTSPHLRRDLNRHRRMYPHEPITHDVCVVGSGVAGMGAAMALAENGHRVTVVERRPAVGGHACSIDLGDGHSGDPAFGSFTGAAYPNVQRLMHKLGVEYEELGPFKEALSYSSLDRRQYWDQIENIPHSRHILDEAARFDAWGILEDENYDYVTAREYFETEGFSEEFIHQYFLGSIIFVFVGHPADYYLDYPIRQLVKYSYMPVVLAGREPVCRVKLGSGHYMRRFREVLEDLGVRFLTSTETSVLERRPSGVRVEFRSGASADGGSRRSEERFDHLVLAVQPAAALSVLGTTAETEEKEILSGFEVTHDTAVVHRDARFMPGDREHWRHGNKIVPDADEAVDRDRPFIFTKWALCNDDRTTDVFSTYAYNRDLGIEGGQRATFDHVKVTPEVVRLRKRIEQRQGLGSVWYAGSWMRAFTLHEDGLVSGLNVANAILAGLAEYPVARPFELTAGRKRVPWGQTHTFVDVVAYQAQIRPGKTALTFVDDDGAEVSNVSFGELYQEAMNIAGNLRAKLGVERGDRVLLIYVPGVEFVIGFVATMLAGAIPVPAYPPNPRQLANDIRKIGAIVESSGARVALTTKDYRRMMKLGNVLSPKAVLRWPRHLKWHNHEDLREPAPGVDLGPRPTQDDLAFLQYTSGSTAEPKGVMITHGNMMHQLSIASEALGFDHETVGVCWVPQYHDLGLVGSILNALYSGAHYVFMSPVSFLTNPALWGEMMHRYRATATAAPDFGYRLLVNKSTPAQRSSWDWSSLKIAMSAGEPVDHETMSQFTDSFACTGIDAHVFSPAYGLAEHVVAVTMGGTRLFHIDKRELQLRGLITFGSHRVVGCGRPPDSVRIAIVDPETRRPAPADHVGEIWVSSPSKAAGYWGRPELTAEVFEARLAEPEPDGDPDTTWLRTGDLGFMHHGEVFVTGRSKDLIILRGRNVYPIDVEKSAERATKDIRPGCSVAFAVGGDATVGQPDEESLVICVELRDRKMPEQKRATLCARIRREVMGSEGVHVGAVALLAPKTVPKTTSGKVRRIESRRRWLEGTLKPLHVDESWSASAATPSQAPAVDQTSVESVLHAAVFEVTRHDVDPAVPLSEQVELDSLEFVEMVDIIMKRLSIDLPITSLTRYPTINGLAGFIRSLPDVRLPDPHLVTLNPDDGSGAPPLFLVHPSRGGIECYLELAKEYGKPLCALRQLEPAASLQEMADTYVAAVKSIRPDGPYVLGGYSYGATVSREMARLLVAGGDEVSGLVLIDEIHRSPSRVLDCPQGEEIGMFLAVSEDYLPTADVDRIRGLLADRREVTLDEALDLVSDAGVQTAIAEQLETYERNIRLLDGNEPPALPATRLVLLKSDGSHNRHLDGFDRVLTVGGDHFSLLYPPHTTALARSIAEIVGELTSQPTPTR